MESMIFKVRPTKEEEFKKLVKKFNRCLKANGMAQIQPILLGKCQIKIKIGATRHYYCVEGNEYQLSFPDNFLSMNGYRFIGEYRRIEKKWHRTMHSDELRDELEVCEANMRCDHCGRDIKNRNGYFFFRDNNDKLVVVGSTCVDAFLGFNIRELLEALGDATEFSRSYGSPDLDKEVIGIDIDSFVAMVSDATNGFSTWKKKTDEYSTSFRLKNELNEIFFFENRKEIPVIENVDKIIAECRDYWNRQYKFDDLSVNSRKSLEGEFVPLRWAGIAGWAIYKAMSDGRNPKHAVSNNDFVGNVGDKMTCNLIPKRYTPFTNKWGDAWAVNFVDEKGNRLVTFTSSKSLMQAVRNSIGQAIGLEFVVASHEVDRGGNTTKIRSAKLAKCTAC